MGGRALTLDEKKERALAKQAARLAEKEESVPIVNEAGEVRTRKKRGTFNGTEGKLNVAHTIEGYHLHILNDMPGRITQALDNGYEFVFPEEVGGVTNSNVTDRNSDLGEKVRFLVGHDEKGNALFGYLMKIPEEWYDEDQQAIQDRNDKIDNAIRKGKVVGDGQTTDGFYVPKGGISMKN